MASVVQLDRVRDREAPLSWLALLTVWFVWGSTFLGIRLAVGSIPPFVMAGSRYLVAGVLLGAILLCAGGRVRERLSRDDLRGIVVSAVLLLVAGNGLLSLGEVHLDSGIAALIVASVPIWMLVIDAIYERRIRAFAIAGVAIGTAGIAALVGAPSAHVPLPYALGIVAGSFAWALGSVIARRNPPARPHPLRSSLEMTIAGALLCTIGLLSGERVPLHAAPSALAGWAWLVVMGSMVAYSAYGYAVRTLPTNVVATYAYVNPIVAVTLGALLLHEPLTLNVAIGGGAIVLAVIAIMLGNRSAVTRSDVARPDNAFGDQKHLRVDDEKSPELIG